VTQDGPEALPGADPATPTRQQAFDRRMLEALVCPLTHARLTYDAEAQELVSKAAHLAFPIRDGIPIMLVDEAREID
jgi:uncharacterized protein YbaR (Trm112 family)